MPAGDRRGPTGMGPMTGRGAGYCAGYDRPGYMNPGFGYRAYGRGGFGGSGFGGRGYRHWYHATGLPFWARSGGYAGAYPPAPAPISPEEEQEMLQSQEKWLEEQLEAVRSQMKKDTE